uniref:Uncharacterized protein n=1 Tax=Arundo donax TaxID=35708 RepID=A0A0A9AKG8_ARUDO
MYTPNCNSSQISMFGTTVTAG